MFKKKPNIKALAPLRSSDRRRIADQIITDFNVNVPQTATDNDRPSPDGDQNQPTGLSSARNSLLPENVLHGKFTTTAGPNLKPVTGAVYAGAHTGEEQRILWVKIYDRMFPTVYTLWCNPGLIPLLHTPPNVISKLQGGADLMIPGLTHGPPFPSSAKKDAIVAVASDERPSVPLWVGVCEIDVGQLQNARGEKGKAVRGIQWVGDEIWIWGTEGRPEIPIPESVRGWDTTGNESSVEESVRTLELEDADSGDDGGVTLDNIEEQKLSADVIGVPVEDHAAGSLHEEYQRQYATKEIDDAFRQAFLYGLYQFRTAHPDEPGHGLNFPLSSSSFISELILPFLPIFDSAEASAFQLRKTSWKNAKRFIKYLDKERLVKSKDRTGNETVVLAIDFDDRAVVEFTPYELPKKASNVPNSQGGSKSLDKDEADSSVGQRLRKVTLYKPKENLSPVFQVSKARSTYTASEIRPMITAYIDAENLVSPTNRKMVKLNPILANSVFNSPSPSDREVLAKGEVSREALMDRVIQACPAFWAILRGDQTTADTKPKAGSAPKIQIVLETRSGNKTVTRVSGLETYYINPQPLADELQKACAGSTTVNQLVGSSPKSPVMEVMVQGPQSLPIIKALERRGVNRQWIDVVDKTKGKKRS